MNILYRIFDADGTLLYVGATTNPALRFEDHSRVQPWWPEVATITLQHCFDWDELDTEETRAIREENPKYNQVHSKTATRKLRKPRRATGTGSLFQRGDGLWVGRVVVGGKVKQVTSKDRDVAERKLAELQASQHEAPCTCGTCEAVRADRERRAAADRIADEFGNAERDIRMAAVAAHARGDYEAERLALDRLALMERAAEAMSPRHSPGDGTMKTVAE